MLLHLYYDMESDTVDNNMGNYLTAQCEEAGYKVPELVWNKSV